MDRLLNVVTSVPPRYAPVEFYLMGLMDREKVPTATSYFKDALFQAGLILDQTELSRQGYFFTPENIQVSLDDFVSKDQNGPRWPASTQKEFKMAVVVVSPEPLDPFRAHWYCDFVDSFVDSFAEAVTDPSPATDPFAPNEVLASINPEIQNPDAPATELVNRPPQFLEKIKVDDVTTYPLIQDAEFREKWHYVEFKEKPTGKAMIQVTAYDPDDGNVLTISIPETDSGYHQMDRASLTQEGNVGMLEWKDADEMEEGKTYKTAFLVQDNGDPQLHDLIIVELGLKKRF